MSTEKKKPKIRYGKGKLKNIDTKKEDHSKKENLNKEKKDSKREKEEKIKETKQDEKKQNEDKQIGIEKEQEKNEKKTIDESKEKIEKSSTYKKTEKKKKESKTNIWMILSIIELIIIIGLLIPITFDFSSQKKTQNDVEIINGSVGDTENSNKEAKVDFYLMSYCPYGNQAEEFIYDVYKNMKDKVAFYPRYVIYTDYAPEGLEDQYCIEDENGTFYCSMHGIQELNQNIRELCVYDLYGLNSWFEFAIKMNSACNSGNADSCWQDVANGLGLDVDKISECQEDEGLKIVKEQYSLNQKYSISGSPTIFINDEIYGGQRTATSMQTILCTLEELKDSESCENIPECSSDSECTEESNKVGICQNPGTKDAKCVYVEDEEVDLIILYDDDCTSCDIDSPMSTNTYYFKNLNVEEIEVDTQEGQELAETYNIEYLPAFIFSDNLNETRAWETEQGLSSYFVKVDDKYLLRPESIGATWPVSEEKRKELEELKETYSEKNLELLGYDSDKPRIDYFVMAFCPYGDPAEEAVYYVYETLGKSIEVVPHYILQTDGTKIQSLHGEQEGNQGIRELCAYEEIGLDKFFDFVLSVNELCSSSNADSCWKDAATDAGLSEDEITIIENCFNEKKIELAKEQEELDKKLLTEDYYSGALIQISASPTFLINGRTYLGSRDAESIKNTICQEFEEQPEGCNQAITQETQTTSGGSC